MQDTIEYQSLKDKTGVQSVVLDIVCKKHLENFGRFPYLDEVPGSNSENHIKERLKIKKDGGAKIDRILETTNSENIEQASFKLNDEYRDKEIKITPIVEEAFIDITTRPTAVPTNMETIYTPDSDVSGPLVILKALDKLANIYGVKINEISDLELESDEWVNLMPRDRLVKAFIYNNEIYLNTDKFSPDSKIHEMLHLLVGSMRFSDPVRYASFIQQAENLPNYNRLALDFQNKTRNDLNEEIFIQELSKYLAGEQSDLYNLDPRSLYEITYNVRRVLDSMLMGQVSTKSISNDVLFDSTLREVVDYTNSDIMTNNFKGFFDDSMTHRKLNNLKSDLIKKNELTEICD